MVSKHYSNQLSNIKIESCFAYFEEIKKNLQIGAQIKIAFFWRRMKKIKEAKKKKTATKKKGKKGKNVKANPA